MRLREPTEGTPYRTTHSEIFEAAYARLEFVYPLIAEAYDLLDWKMSRRPWDESLPIATFPDRKMRLILTAKTARFPSLRVLGEIDDERRLVKFWHMATR